MQRVSQHNRPRIGIVGFGQIGSHLYREITARPGLGLEVAFVADPRPGALDALPPEVALANPEAFADREPDLVVETAHPDVSRAWGARFLAAADYMPLSLTALADPGLLDAMLAAADRAGTCLFVPHGAATGLDCLHECRDLWESVTVTMRKNPRNLDFSAAPGRAAADITSETVLYDGPTRGVCPLYPRNVNTHAAAALAGIGFDRTRSVLVADPALDVSVIEIEARAPGGVALRVARTNPLAGVSGILTLRSVVQCVAGAKSPARGLRLC